MLQQHLSFLTHALHLTLTLTLTLTLSFLTRAVHPNHARECVYVVVILNCVALRIILKCVFM